MVITDTDGSLKADEVGVEVIGPVETYFEPMGKEISGGNICLSGG